MTTSPEKIQATEGDVRQIVWQAWLALDRALGGVDSCRSVETLEATVAKLRAELASREPKCTRVHYEGLYERAKFEEALRVVSEDRDRLRSELAACHGTVGQLSRESLHVEQLRETSTQQTEVIERLRKELHDARNNGLREALAAADDDRASLNGQVMKLRSERDQLRRDLLDATARAAVADQLAESIRRDLTAEVQRNNAIEAKYDLAVEHLESLADNLKAAHEQARDWRLTT